MSTRSDLNGGQQVCDEQGRIVAVVLANQAFENLMEENKRLREEAARVQAEAAELRRALNAVREELKDKAALAAERDGYLKSLHYLTRKDFTFTAEEIADLDENGIELNEDFIAELEQSLRDRESTHG